LRNGILALTISADSVHPETIPRDWQLFTIKELCLSRGDWIDNACIQRISTSGSLRNLELNTNSASNAGVESLARIRTLRRISFDDSGIGSETWIEVFSSLPELNVYCTGNSTQQLKDYCASSGIVLQTTGQLDGPKWGDYMHVKNADF
jgi:hypothetical protein